MMNIVEQIQGQSSFLPNCEKLLVIYRSRYSQAVVAQTFNPSTQEAEVGRSQSSRPAWATELVLG